MINQQLAEKLERTLAKQQRKRRLIELSLLVLFLTISILSIILRESTKQVITHGEYFYKWEEVSYNNIYVIGIIIGVIGTIYTGCILFGDIISSRFDTIEANGHYITIYKANTANIVYVNGEEKGRLTFLSFTHYIEVKLPDGVKATISFGRGLFTPVHISYSDNTPSVDL